jgi:hypothetical protein
MATRSEGAVSFERPSVAGWDKGDKDLFMFARASHARKASKATQVGSGR